MASVLVPLYEKGRDECGKLRGKGLDIKTIKNLIKK